MLITSPVAALSVTILGDSLTAGYGLPEEQSYPARLQERLRTKGYDITIINAGVSGDTTAGGLARLDWVLSDRPDAVPDAVIVALGANDMLRGFDPAVTRENLSQILDRLKKRNIPVLLMGMKASANLGWSYRQAFDLIYPELAAQYNVPLYPFFLEGVALSPELNQPDLLHPNAEGVNVLVQKSLSAVEQFILGLQ